MLGLHRLPPRLAGVGIALIALVAPLAAQAQDVPSYAQPAYVSTDETIHGRIRSVDGAFNISVDDDRGFVDNVQLHQGTIINPTGLTLSQGMSVTIAGVNDGSTFGANEIDTPYSYAGPLPTPVYLGPGYWCPGFAYGYWPSFSLAIVIGGGYVHRPFYGRPWNGHAYFGGYVGRAPVGDARLDATRAIGSSQRHVPSAFAGRAFAGESRPGGVRYPAAGGSAAHGPDSYAHGAPAEAFSHGMPGGYAHGTPGGSAPGGAPHNGGAAGGFSHGGGAHGSAGGGHGGGGASHGGGGHNH
jgi:hypothetical protein